MYQGSEYLPRYSYNDIIIIITNVIILEFLSARFVHPGAPELTILSLLTRVRVEEYLKLTNF